VPLRRLVEFPKDFLAEFDPMRDEGNAYARKLVAAGVDQRANRFGRSIHDGPKFHGLRLEAELSFGDARNVQKVVHQPNHVANLAFH
jgi:acetyl esterase/lipase